MGERGNIVVAQHAEGASPLYLYTHRDGPELPGILQRALAKRWRWDDEQYLARIIFCEMIRGREQDEVGYGLSTYLVDNGWPILLVDAERQRVRVTGVDLGDGPEYSFEAYLALDLEVDGWDTLKAAEGEVPATA